VNISRLALHAYAIEFELPAVAPQKRGELIKIIAPYPADFEEVVNFFKVA
jgi:hypothetical protein